MSQNRWMEPLRRCLVLGAFGLCLGTTTPVWAGPEDDQFNFALGLLIDRDYPSAREEFEAYLKRYATGAKAAEARYWVAECFYRQENFKAALAAYQEALTKAPAAKEAPRAQYHLGMAAVRLGDQAQAAQAFTAAAAKGEGELREEALVALADSLGKLQRHADAAAACQELLKDFPKSAQRDPMAFARGWNLLQAGKAAEAVTALTTLVAQDPPPANADQARLLLSDAHTALKQYDQAAVLLRQLLTTEGAREEALLRLAWTQYKSQDLAGAANSFLEFATKFPKSAQVPSALYNAGLARYQLKQYGPAVAAFEQLAKTAPASPEAKTMRLCLGLSQRELGQHAAAAKTLEAALADGQLAGPDLGTARYAAGLARAAANEHAAAAKHFAALLELGAEHPMHDHGYLALARAQEQAGDLPAASATLAKFLAQRPDSPQRANALLSAGEYAWRQQTPAKAIPWLKELLALPGAPPAAAYRLAWCHYELQDFAAAQAVFAQLAETPGEYRAEALYMAGRAAEQAGQVAAAGPLYERLVGLKGTDEHTGKALLRLGQLAAAPPAAEAALASYRERFPKGPHLAALRLRLAELQAAAGDLTAAQGHYEALLAETPPAELAPAISYGLGWCLLRAGKLPEAEAALAKVPSTDLTQELARLALLQRGEIAYQREQYAAAQGHFAPVAAAKAPQAERALYMLGWSARRLEQREPAEQAFRALLERFPTSELAPDAALRLAEALLAKPAPAEARKVLETALTKLADGPAEDLRHRLAETLAALEAWGDLRAHCQDMLKRYPESKQRYLMQFRLGLAAQALGLFEEGLAAYEATIAGTDTSEAARAQFNLASLHYSQKAWLEAAKQYLRVEMLYDFEDLAPKALYHAIDAFMLSGDEGPRRASVHQKKLQDKYPTSDWAKKALERWPPKP